MLFSITRRFFLISLLLLAGCMSTRTIIPVDIAELDRTHACEEPLSFRVYWWLYGSLPLSFPDKELFPDKAGTIYVYKENRSALDYSLTVLLGTLFSITTAELEVYECHSLRPDDSVSDLQRVRDEMIREKERREEAHRRAEEQRRKQESLP